MGTLSVRPKSKHSPAFWPLTIVGLFVLALVIGVVLLLLFVPGLADAIYIEWTILTGHAVGGRPQ